jgi:hypothetical protein
VPVSISLLLKTFCLLYIACFSLKNRFFFVTAQVPGPLLSPCFCPAMVFSLQLCSISLLMPIISTYVQDHGCKAVPVPAPAPCAYYTCGSAPHGRHNKSTLIGPYSVYYKICFWCRYRYIFPFLNIFYSFYSPDLS